MHAWRYGREKGRDFLLLGGLAFVMMGILSGLTVLSSDLEIGKMLEFTLTGVAVFLVLGVGGWMQARFLPDASEGTLLAFAFVALYASLTLFGSGTNLMLLVAGAYFLITVLLALIDHRFSSLANIVVYAFYLVVLALVAVSSFIDFDFGSAGSLDLFVAGFGVAYIVFILVSLLLILPFPGKHESLSEMRARLKEQGDIYSGMFDGRDLGLARALVLALLFGVPLAVNYYLRLVEPSLAIYAGFIALSLLPDALCAKPATKPKAFK